jgi:hypothetical protein
MEGQSALANFNITQWPLGTTAEVAATGYDPATVASCCDGLNGARPCPVWASCRFHQRVMGGFKGTGGPKYVGYRYIDPSDGTATQDVIRCHSYVLTLQGQADAGAAERRVSGGKRGKIIKVIAQEGEEIVTHYNLPVNGKGQVINPMPEMIETLKANKIEFSSLPNEVAVTWRGFDLKRLVPRHPRPGEPTGDSFAHRVAKWDAEDEAGSDEYAGTDNTPATEMPTASKMPLTFAEPVAKAVKG